MALNMPFIPLEFYTRLTYYACINILYKSKSPESPCRINAKTMSAPNTGLIRALRSLLPAESVLVDAEDLRPFECDGLAVYRQLPMVVVLPETIEQVQEHHAPVPCAAGAGGGARRGHRPFRRRIAAWRMACC